MYRYNDKVIRAGQSWKDDAGFTHPSNWMLWSDDVKAQKGLVWEDDPEPFDPRFYYGPNNPKPLEELVAQAIRQTKESELALLSKTDWMVIKSVEVETYGMPQKVVEFRSAVRERSEEISQSFAACKNVEQLIAATIEAKFPEADDE